MARGPLHYIILYTYSLLSLDRGWGPQSVSASACAREDRHVGGSRWADAIDIHSDAESIRIPLLVCHRVIWDPGLSGRAGLLYARGAYLGYLRLQFRTPLASPLTSLSLQNTPNNQFVPSLPSPIDMLVCDLHFVRVYYPSGGRASHVCVTLSRTRARVRAQLALALSWDLEASVCQIPCCSLV